MSSPHVSPHVYTHKFWPCGVVLGYKGGVVSSVNVADSSLICSLLSDLTFTVDSQGSGQVRNLITRARNTNPQDS